MGGTLSELRASGLASATACLDGDLPAASYDDVRPDPAPGDGYYYIVQGRNDCGGGGYGVGRAALDALDCSGP